MVFRLLFFIKVEENGGNPDLGIELMLNDRDDWVSSIVNEQKDKAYAGSHDRGTFTSSDRGGE